MRTLTPGRGDSKVGCIVWLVLLGLAAYIGYQAVPAQMKTSELKKFLIGLAEHKAEEPIERIEATVLARIEELGIPVDKRALRVERLGGRIRISYSYSIPIDFLVTTYQWPIEVEVDRLIVIT